MKFLSKSPQLLIITVASLVIVGCTSYSRGNNQVEVVEAEEKRALNLLQQINQLEVENAELKNQVEVLQYEMNQLNRRAESQQAELDRLYQKEGLSGYTYQPGQDQLPQTGATDQVDTQGGYQAQTDEIQIGDTQSGQYPAVTPTPAPQSLPQTSTSAISAQDMYNNGFEQLKQGQYDESIQTFNQLLSVYPTSTFADDAQYWTGEAHYVNREFNNARQAFNNVVNNYPDSDRAPDALLKIGYIYYEQGDVTNARNVFSDIIARYPNNQVADFARERLKNLGG